jgi:hypothetical protein
MCENEREMRYLHQRAAVLWGELKFPPVFVADSTPSLCNFFQRARIEVYVNFLIVGLPPPTPWPIKPIPRLPETLFITNYISLNLNTFFCDEYSKGN